MSQLVIVVHPHGGARYHDILAIFSRYSHFCRNICMFNIYLYTCNVFLLSLPHFVHIFNLVSESTGLSFHLSLTKTQTIAKQHITSTVDSFNCAQYNRQQCRYLSNTNCHNPYIYIDGGNFFFLTLLFPSFYIYPVQCDHITIQYVCHSSVYVLLLQEGFPVSFRLIR